MCVGYKVGWESGGLFLQKSMVRWWMVKYWVE